ncbi:MAG: NAD(P)/FAD-dependent oxidoreductase [Lachnospiraceae bacterium]|nr:NAD(P)/FAD-dependent oxidoreductase [Lachnospiraceae bacterium]
MSETVVIGGGAAGMFFGILAAQNGHKVTIIEQNEKLGKKLFITGKGRCNFTNNCTPEEFRSNVVTNPRFLFSASEAMTPEDVIGLFEEWGLRTKTERGRRAFPESDHSADVIDTLKKQLHKNGVRVLLHTKAVRILSDENGITGVEVESTDADKAEKSRILPCSNAVIATGGISYPSTGATGDGYRFAKDFELRVTDLYPSLVPLVCAEEYVKEMQGLSLKNVELHIRSGKKELYNEFGEMMFTHFGITGPLVLSASALIGPQIGKKQLTAWIDLKPAVSEEQLDARLLRVFEENKNKTLKNILGEFYPQKMHPVITAVSGLDPETRIHTITKEQRTALIQTTKHFPITLTALRGYAEAVVTKGGISVKEINPTTMEVKKIPGLYVIGEALDLDAFTGGYNLQIAWCTAAAAARHLN